MQVRSLESLRQSHQIQDAVGVLKIDTEGFDLEVLRGIGDLACDVVMTEFWDRQTDFGREGAANLDALVGQMRVCGYGWHIVVYKLSGKPISYYCNRRASVPGSWGNAIFFKDRGLFREALEWCSSALPVTHFRA